MDHLTDIAKRLGAAGIEDPRREARALMRAVTGVDPLIGTIVDSPALQTAIEQRCARVPLSKIVGHREFYGRDFIVNEHVLDPRPDSETLIEAALRVLPDDARIADLGTGSGCLILTLLAERADAHGTAIDISPDVLAVARANADALGLSGRVQFLEAGFAEFVPEDLFDVLVSNPPYIPSAECDTLAPEVKNHDPRLALDGGADGCGPYRVIFERMRGLLRPGGHFLVELSPDICHKVHQLAIEAGHRDIHVIRDLAGKERVLAGVCG